MHVYREGDRPVVRLHRPRFSNVPAELREQIEAEGAIFIADKVGVTKRLNYKRKIPSEVLGALPARTLAFPVEPIFVYRAAGVRPK